MPSGSPTRAVQPSPRRFRYVESLDFGAIARQLLTNTQRAHASGHAIETVFVVFELDSETPGSGKLNSSQSVLRVCGSPKLHSTSLEHLLPLLDALLMSAECFAEQPQVAGVLINESDSESLSAQVVLASHDSVAMFRIEPQMREPLLSIKLKRSVEPPASA